MYLHRMTLQALGPFAGRYTIDFTELAASGLFLLEGPTGSGKSSLIDAIVFALYGKVASREASDDRLRSAHAAPGDETFVDLVLETTSGIYRVRRSPAYQRPKQRGAGTTLQQAQVRLWRLTSPDAPDGDVLSTRADEAGAELRRAVGLDREQFVQTIVLPQGEFASFLRADPESRRGLLQQVFGTEVYERLQQRLERMRAEVGRTVEESRQRVDRAVAAFAGAAAPAEDDPVRTAGPGTAVDLARAVCRALAASAARADDAARAARATAEAARLEHERVGRLAETARRRDRARAELLVLEAAGATHAADLARVADARRVLPLLPLVAAVDRVSRSRAEAEDAADAAGAAAGPALHELVEREGGQALVAERDRCTGERAALARALRLEEGLAGRAADLEAWAGRAHEATAALAAARRALAARPAARAEQERARAAAAAPAAGLDQAAARLGAAQERRVAALDAERLATEVTDGEMALAATVAAARAAVDTAAALQRARIAGMAGELAEGLVPGETCPVCGSTEHPAPATRVDPVDDVDLAAAEERRAAATAALGSASTELERLRERRDQRGLLAGGTVAELTLGVAEARSAVEAAERAAAEVRRADAALAAFDAVTREAEQQLADRERAAAVDDERRAAATAELARHEAEVRAARGALASVAERAAELDRTGARAAAWARALDERERAVDVERRARQRLADGLAELEVAGVDEVAAASLPAAELSALESGLRRHEDALARVRGVLEEPEVQDLTEEPDLAGARAAHAAATSAADALTAEATRQAHRRAAADEALVVLVEAVARYERETAEAEPVVRMANLAAASTADNALTLATYVLGRRFGDLVVAANARLVSMSDGRYELLHSERREDVRSRRTGLALAVLDHSTESTRDPRTLSGGETFYVSLCLALGLADVVTAEAGGIDLGTLFVDEGFGSLDPETLDVVLAELSRLRDGGRVVGVVSHVETLKSAIAERLEVRRLPDGSSAVSVRA